MRLRDKTIKATVGSRTGDLKFQSPTPNPLAMRTGAQTTGVFRAFRPLSSRVVPHTLPYRDQVVRANRANFSFYTLVGLDISGLFKSKNGGCRAETDNIGRREEPIIRLLFQSVRSTSLFKLENRNPTRLVQKP